MSLITTIEGRIRALNTGRQAGVTPAVVTHVLKCSVDPTQASAGVGKFLPAGALVFAVSSGGGATGGTNPTINVGYSVGASRFALNLPADVASSLETTGSHLLVEDLLLATTEIYAGVGGSAATGGTTTFYVHFFMKDSGG